MFSFPYTKRALLLINNSNILVALLLTLLKNTVYNYFFLRFGAKLNLISTNQSFLELLQSAHHSDKGIAHWQSETLPKFLIVAPPLHLTRKMSWRKTGLLQLPSLRLLLLWWGRSHIIHRQKLQFSSWISAFCPCYLSIPFNSLFADCHIWSMGKIKPCALPYKHCWCSKRYRFGGESPETAFETIHTIQHKHCFWPFQVHTADCSKCFIPFLISEHIDTSKSPHWKAFSSLLTFISRSTSHLASSFADFGSLIYANSV